MQDVSFVDTVVPDSPPQDEVVIEGERVPVEYTVATPRPFKGDPDSPTIFADPPMPIGRWPERGFFVSPSSGDAQDFIYFSMLPVVLDWGSALQVCGVRQKQIQFSLRSFR